MEQTRRNEIQQLGFLILGAAVARWVLTRFINGPSIFTDEYQYVEMARMLPHTLAQGTGLYWDEQAAYFPCWLYPMLIAPLLRLFSWDTAYHAIQGLNALMVSLAIVPVYFLARELADHRRALLAAALTALLPGAGFSPMIMTENLFFPLFLLAVWAIWRAVLVPTPWRRLGAGLAAGLAFHAKPHGLILPIAIAVTVLVFEADRLRDEPPDGRSRLVRWMGGVARHWLTALGWILAMIPRILIVKYMERPDVPVSFMTIIGAYKDLARGRQDVGAASGTLSLLRYGLAWAWCLGLLPAWALACKTVDSLRRREAAPMRLLVLLTLAVTAGMLAMVSRHTMANNDIWRLHERYFFPVLPLAIVVFCAGAGVLNSPPAVRWLWDAVLVAVVFLNAWIAQNVSWALPSSSPTFTPALMLMHTDLVGAFVAFGFLIPALAAVGLLLFRETSDFRWQCLTVGLLLLAFNAGWYGYHGTYLNRERKDDLNIAKKVGRTMGDGDSLLILDDGLARSLAWQVGIRNPGIAVSLKTNELDNWYESRLRFNKDGSLRSPLPGKHTWLLASDAWKANQGPVKGFDNCALYRLDRKPPFQLDSAQIEEFRKLGETTDTLSDGRAHAMGVKLTITTRTLPLAFIAGSEDRVNLKIRNDGKFALPGGSMRMAMGYHWSDPKRLGTWTAVVWDDEHNARLPEWLEPGETCDIALTVHAPERPGDQYRLDIKPVLLVYHGKQKDKTWIDDRTQGVADWVKVAPGKEIAAKKADANKDTGATSATATK